MDDGHGVSISAASRQRVGRSICHIESDGDDTPVNTTNNPFGFVLGDEYST